MVEPELKAMMTQAVLVQDATGVDEYGKRVRGAATSYPCHLQIKAQEVAGRGGQVVQSSGTAWLDDYYPGMDAADSADVPTLGKVPIVAVQHVYDETGPYYTALYFGAS